MNRFKLFSLLFLFVLGCYGQESHDKIEQEHIETVRGKLIQDITKKLARLTERLRLKHTPEEIVQIISNKLKSAIPYLGPDPDKSVKIILEGIKVMLRKDILSDTTTAPEKIIKINRKKYLPSKVAEKLADLARKAFPNADTNEDKLRIIEEFKKKMEGTTRNNAKMLSNNTDVLNAYSNIVLKSVDLITKRILDSGIQQDRVPPLEPIQNTNYVRPKSVVPKIMESGIRNVGCDCDCTIKEICSRVKSLRQVQCTYDRNYIPLQRLCDLVHDCADGTDEYQCWSKGSQSIHIANQIIGELESTFLNKCLTLRDKLLPAAKDNILSKVIQTQSQFLRKYKIDSISGHLLNNTSNAIRKGMSDVIGVLSSVQEALDVALCSHLDKASHQSVPHFVKLESSEEVDAKKDTRGGDVWTPKLCSCEEQYCRNGTQCPGDCQRVCWHRYNLNRWSCQAVVDDGSISINAICNGIIDCFDETDEIGCIDGSIGKFQADDVYSYILKILTTKSASSEYAHVKLELLALHAAILKLQRQNTRNTIDDTSIKMARNQCFSLLINVYNGMLDLGLEKAQQAYIFLSSLNEKLVRALKFVSNGNVGQHSSLSCACKEGGCASPVCTPRCAAICAAKPKLTYFQCYDNKISVPPEAVCNGKVNCPDGEDEKDCKNEICRRHHFVLLHNNVKNFGEKYLGTALGEVMKSWQNKVTATLQRAERDDPNNRPNHRALRIVVTRILDELVISYVSADVARRNNPAVELEFLQLSNTIISILKSCKI